MAETTNRAWVGDALDLLAKGLRPFVETHVSKTVPRGEDWVQEFVRADRRTLSLDDPSFLLEVLDRRWRRVSGQFPDATRRSIRHLVCTLREERNIWAHNNPIDRHDAAHAISGIIKLLRAVDAVEADEAQRLLDSFNRAQNMGGMGSAPPVRRAPGGNTGELGRRRRQPQRPDAAGAHLGRRRAPWPAL